MAEKSFFTCILDLISKEKTDVATTWPQALRDIND